ncbi:ribonuclease P protein subunit p20 isoform X1 [Silurus meridionalis]|uniref:Ribonuclease P protein subunit p20 n=1 Tax=Silurus meridionalis TaxID=175797 RepID=A0A8T0BGY7_SILME|nr:ribonuclease P protein subunit p20 isoform X1 [Silurus meridionalis]KAF7706512.1 hypothetical protein HF521_019766 [Silurus meridionalis]
MLMPQASVYFRCYSEYFLDFPQSVAATGPNSRTALIPRSCKMAEPRSQVSTSMSQKSLGFSSSEGPATEMDPVEYTLRKRLPRKLPKRRNDVYINMKTDFKAQLARCQKLLDGGAGHREICIHGLGLAINRAINIALQLQAFSQGALQIAANTSTVELIDDLEPEDPDEAGEPLTRTRNNSAIHIKVFYPNA